MSSNAAVIWRGKAKARGNRHPGLHALDRDAVFDEEGIGAIIDVLSEVEHAVRPL